MQSLKKIHAWAQMKVPLSHNSNYRAKKWNLFMRILYLLLASK